MTIMRMARTMALVLTLASVAGVAAHAGDAEGPRLSVRTTFIASEGYIYGFPILLMDETRRAATEVPYVCGLGGPENAFTHLLDPPGPDFRAVVRPNVDTLYSSAFLDLSAGAVVLDVPEVQDRFYLMAMLDAWTNNFAGPGSQTNGGEATRYLITGPDWAGDIPAGMEQIEAPTDMVWIIGRTELKGPDDLEAANRVQQSFGLRPLNGPEPVRSEEACQPILDRISPEDTIRALSGAEFFQRLDALIARYPPPAADAGKLETLGQINVGPYANGRISDLSENNLEALDRGVERGQSAMDAGFSFASRGTWTPDPERVPLGDYGDQFLVRGIVSQIGFGANRNEFAVYQNARRTARGGELDGREGVYRLVFENGDTPPVGAFWSVTVYDGEGFLVANALDRYALGSNSDLQADANGDVVITFARERPDDVPVENWLPVPDGPFEVTLRMYWPNDPILNGRWSAPAISRQ